MRQRHTVALLRLVLVGATLAVGLLAPLGASAGETSFADAAFEKVWDQADGPVASGAAQRSWLWGPGPIGVRRDAYAESTAPGGLRLVQFFDKARMEITDPNGDPASPWYVTSGLLVKELVSGKRQIGNDSYAATGQPAAIPLAGDQDADSPTYADFVGVTTLDGQANRAPDRTGEIVSEWIAPGGEVSQGARPATATLADYEDATGHNIPDVFWNWMNDPENGVTAYGSWVYPMGYPISEPYWLTAPVGGVPHAMLVQLYERRVLTWTPDNPAEWQVEMGNVGRHWLQWFEPAEDSSPTWSADSNWIAFTSRRAGNAGVYLIHPGGSGLTAVADTPYDEGDAHWVGDAGRILYQRADADDSYWATDLDGGNPQQIDTAGAPVPSPDGEKLAWVAYDEETGTSDLWLGQDAGDRLLASDVYPAGSWTFAWSPDSSRIAFWRRDSSDDLDPWVSVQTVDLLGAEQTVVDAWHFTWWVEMSWSPDGASLALTRASVDGHADLLVAPADGGSPLTVVDSRAIGLDARFPDWSPAGNGIVFEGNDGLWSVHGDGSGLTRLTANASDAQARYCPDGSKLAFIRDGALWIIDSDGSNATQLDAAPGP